MSAPEREFRDEARLLDTEFQRLLAASELGNVELNVFANRHLEKRDFGVLRTDIAGCIDQLKSSLSGYELDRPYQIVLRDMAAQYGPLSALCRSTGCRVISPEAKNEQRNFEDAIRKGCDNLYAQTKDRRDPNTCRMIMLRLSNSASAHRCLSWADWYFQEYPAEPIDVILLYQPAIVVDETSNEDKLVHHVTPIFGPRFQKWRKRDDGSFRSLPSASFFVGLISTTPSPVIFTNGEATLDLSGHYIYQRVDAYQRVLFKDGAIGNLSNPAPGIIIHSALEENNSLLRILSPVFGREKGLTLLP